MPVTGGAAAVASPLVPFITPTPVSACGTLSVPGSYVLVANLGPSAGNCLVVSAPNVRLNLGGHTVTGTGAPSSAGVVLLPGALGSRVYSTRPGAVVTSFQAGLADEANGAVITGPRLWLKGNTASGVVLLDVTGSAVQLVRLDGNGHFGANIEGSSNSLLRDNQADANGTYGLWDQASTSSRLIGNRVEGNKLAGIYLGCSDTGNLQDVGCAPSSDSLIQTNTVLLDGQFGIAISDLSLGNHVVGNNAKGAKRTDLWDENYHCSGGSASPNVWQKNTGSRNQTFSPTCIG